MVRHGEWEVCTHTPTQSVLPSQLLADPQGKELLGVPVTQPMVDLLCAIFQCTDVLKSSTANQIVRMWPAHYKQFSLFQTTMSESDRDVLHITNVKAIQHKINTSKRKAQHSMAEDKVLLGSSSHQKWRSCGVQLCRD